MDILSSRHTPRFGKAEAIVLAAYSLLLAWTVAHHAPWADEAQSWLLARDSSLTALFKTNLHFEGTPGLWHLFLWLLCRMHVSYAGMHWFAALIAITGIWVFLRFSPFPLLVRIALPFSFYLFYQYAVIARSYVAVPLLVFIIAALFSRPAQNLIAIAVVLGLLGNLCTQGLVLSAGFAFVLFLHLRQQGDSNSTPPGPRRITAALLILSAFWAAAVWTALPSADNSFMPVAKLINRIAPPPPASIGSANSAAQTPPAQEKPDDPYESCHPVTLAQDLGFIVTGGLSNSWLLTLITLGIIFAFLASSASQERLLDIAPYFMLQCFFLLVLEQPWHLGMLFVALIGILWINWPREETRRERIWSALLVSAVLAVSIDQAFWSARAIKTDLQGNYSGDKQAAEFLKSHAAGKRVAGFRPHSVGVLPYFSSNIFENQHQEGFWFWSRMNHTDDRVMETVLDHPDFIVIGFLVHLCNGTTADSEAVASSKRVLPGMEERILASGLYVETHRFCGDAFSGHDSQMTLCQVILEPVTR